MKQTLLVLTAAALAAGFVFAEGPRKRDAAWVDARIDAWQPKGAECAFDRIGWAGDVREALRLAKEHGRPVFLFTYDGASLSCYRC
jgi:hypothetical protein